MSHKEKRCIVQDLATSSFLSAVPGQVDTATNITNEINASSKFNKP